MTKYCHEMIIVVNRAKVDGGTQVTLTGMADVFSNESDALKNAALINRTFDLGLEVFPYVESEWY